MIVVSLGVASLLVATLVGLGLARQHQRAGQPTARITLAAPTTADRPSDTYAAWFGDSFTTGTGAQDKHHRFPNQVSWALGWVEENFGVGGTGYTKVDKRNGGPYDAFVPKMAAATFKPSIVVVSGGRNDGLYETGLPGYEAAVAKTFRDIRAAVPDAKIVALPQTWGVTGPIPDKFPYEAGVIKRAVEAVGGQYVDIGYPLLGKAQYDAADHVHVNDSGYIAYSQAIVDAFLKAGIATRVAHPLPDPAQFAGMHAPPPPSTTAPATPQ